MGAKMRFFICLLLLVMAPPVHAADDHLVRIETRPGVTVPFYYMNRPGAGASVVLLTGGRGGIGMKQGVPTSNNFLVRSRDLFEANGFNVAVVGLPSDHQDLDAAFRVTPEHVQDLKRVVAWLRQDAPVPVWVVGTSMGTVSAAALASAAGTDMIGGIVLTSSVTRDKPGALLEQRLDLIRIPVLLVHHDSDQCRICPPGDVPEIVKRLKNAPVKKAVYVSGGSEPTGPPCEPLHRHGFPGLEKDVVLLISNWIKNPSP